MPRTTSTTPTRAAALPPDLRRAAIIEAIGPLLIEHGERITTRQIAEAAGVAEGTIFSVFADKDELLLAALDAAVDMGDLEAAIGAIDRETAFEAQLVEATEAIQHRVETVWQLLSNIGPKLREQAARPMTDSEALTALLAAHRDRLTVEPAVAARLLRGVTLSMTHPMLGGTRTSPTEIVAFFLHGVERSES